MSPGSAGFLSPHQHMLCARAWSPRRLDQQRYTAGLGLMASRPQASPLLRTASSASPGLSVSDPGQAPRLPPALSFPGAWRGLLPSPLLPPLQRQSHFLSVTLEHRTLTLGSRTPAPPIQSRHYLSSSCLCWQQPGMRRSWVLPRRGWQCPQRGPMSKGTQS